MYHSKGIERTSDVCAGGGIVESAILSYYNRYMHMHMHIVTTYMHIMMHMHSHTCSMCMCMCMCMRMLYVFRVSMHVHVACMRMCKPNSVCTFSTRTVCGATLLASRVQEVGVRVSWARV